MSKCVCVCCWFSRLCKQEGCLCTKRRGPRGLKLPYCANPDTRLPTQPAPSLLNPPSPPPVPPPLLHSQLSHSHTHSHTPFSLSCCVPVPLSHSLSISSKWPELLSSLLSSLYPSTTLFLSPPAVRATSPSSALLVFTSASEKDPQACNFSQTCPEDFIFILDPFLFPVLNPSPPERLVSVCLACARQCVRGLWCRALCPEGAPKACDWSRDVFTTMNVQLLLLLALVGPFCAFTHASKWTLCYHRPAISTLRPLRPSASMCPPHTTLCLLLIPADGTITLWRLVAEGRINSILMGASIN